MECLADLAPLVHWSSLAFVIPAALFMGFVLGRLGRAGQHALLDDRVRRWEIVAKARGWNYSITPLKGTEILANMPEE